ncbi:MAG: hypothetical protein IJB01_03805 [Bacteroidaceae bacterium]|nr:hypothetical protein [Bacteroidaceae bacterium]
MPPPIYRPRPPRPPAPPSFRPSYGPPGMGGNRPPGFGNGGGGGGTRPPGFTR